MVTACTARRHQHTRSKPGTQESQCRLTHPRYKVGKHYPAVARLGKQRAGPQPVATAAPGIVDDRVVTTVTRGRHLEWVTQLASPGLTSSQPLALLQVYLFVPMGGSSQELKPKRRRFDDGKSPVNTTRAQLCFTARESTDRLPPVHRDPVVAAKSVCQIYHRCRNCSPCWCCCLRRRCKLNKKHNCRFKDCWGWQGHIPQRILNAGRSLRLPELCSSRHLFVIGERVPLSHAALCTKCSPPAYWLVS